MNRTDEVEQSGTPEKIGVFISYSRADRLIATALSQCLITLSSELNPFIDHANLKAGDDYDEVLARSISASQWFLMLCSGPISPEKDMGWCMYEAGQFRRKLLGENKEALIQDRLVVLHDDDRPKQLSKFQSVYISEKDIYGASLDLRPEAVDSSLMEGTAVFSLFQTIIKHSRPYPLRDLTDGNVRKLLRTNAQLMIAKFVAAQVEIKLPEKVLQPRISFKLPPTPKGGSAKLTPDIQIVGYESSLSIIFSIAGTETTWGAIKSRCKEPDGSDALWLSEVEAATEQVSQDFVPEQPEGLCLAKADRQFYRVLFARYEPFRSKARICYIVFIPCRFRGFDIKKRTSILLSALILSIRFRQRILPYVKLIPNARNEEKLDCLMRLEKELHAVETEAQEFGLSGMKGDEDDPPLLSHFREGNNKQFVENSMKSWGAGRRALGDAIMLAGGSSGGPTGKDSIAQAADIAVNELQNVEKVNGRFIQVLIEELEFVEKVGL